MITGLRLFDTNANFDQKWQKLTLALRHRNIPASSCRSLPRVRPSRHPRDVEGDNEVTTRATNGPQNSGIGYRRHRIGVRLVWPIFAGSSCTADQGERPLVLGVQCTYGNLLRWRSEAMRFRETQSMQGSHRPKLLASPARARRGTLTLECAPARRRERFDFTLFDAFQKWKRLTRRPHVAGERSTRSNGNQI